MSMNHLLEPRRSVARCLGVAPGAEPSDAQLAAADELLTSLKARGLAVIPKELADHVERRQRKTGGEHPLGGQWQARELDGWVHARLGRHQAVESGFFSPAEAREIAHALILFAEQAERARL